MGSSRILKLLPKVKFKRRIGLSATPERQFDSEGTGKIFGFFNCENNYTYEFSMEQAIKGDKDAGIEPVLCRYYYYPHLVSLTESELQEYKEISFKITKFYNADSDDFKNNPILTALLLARKRIIHKAYNKLATFRNIIRKQYSSHGNLKYTLIYVPEGNQANDNAEDDFFIENEGLHSDPENNHLIDIYSNAVKEIHPRTTIKKFTSGTNDREEILNGFANGELEVLTSMKCLDEGVDVPRAELAIFCASTGNPRQFIQRRGRILRTHPQKSFAYIHDLVVIPEINSASESYNLERSMLRKELERVNNFALLAENSAFTVNVLLDTMNYYNLNLYNNEQ
jgi:superfamily II DNA or RNA helicase